MSCSVATDGAPRQAMNNQTPRAARRAGIGHNRGGGEGCGYATSLRQRKRVARVPTAERSKKRLDA